MSWFIPFTLYYFTLSEISSLSVEKCSKRSSSTWVEHISFRTACGCSNHGKVLDTRPPNLQVQVARRSHCYIVETSCVMKLYKIIYYYKEKKIRCSAWTLVIVQSHIPPSNQLIPYWTRAIKTTEKSVLRVFNGTVYVMSSEHFFLLSQSRGLLIPCVSDDVILR